MEIQEQKIAPPIPNFTFKNNIPPYGVYHGKIADTNTSAWDGGRGWLSARRWSRKAWIFLGAYTPEFVMGFAIIDLGYTGNAFCYAYDRTTNTYWEKEYMTPLGFGKNFHARLEDHWELGPYQIWSEQGQWNFSYQHKKAELLLQFTEPHQGISAICPSSGKRPFHHTYKNLLLPTSIYYRNGSKEYKNTQAMGGLDYSKGYPPRHTVWNWTSFMGKLEDGTPVGINTVNGFNNELENALWINGSVERLGKMQYAPTSTPIEETWFMKAKNEELYLQLRPEGIRRQDIDLKLAKSKFKQVFGPIKGQLYHQNTWKKLEGYGVMEDHEALW